MKFLLILWTLGGPQVEGVFSSFALCRGVASSLEEQAAIRFCVPMDVDSLITDVVLYPHPEHLRSE